MIFNLNTDYKTFAFGLHLHSCDMCENIGIKFMFWTLLIGYEK